MVDSDRLELFKKKIAAKKAILGEPAKLLEPPAPPKPIEAPEKQAEPAERLSETLKKTEERVDDISGRVKRLEAPDEVEDEPLAPMEEESSAPAEDRESAQIDDAPEPEGDDIFLSAQEYHILMQRVGLLSKAVGRINENISVLEGRPQNYDQIDDITSSAQKTLQRLGTALSKTRRVLR